MNARRLAPLLLAALLIAPLSACSGIAGGMSASDGGSDSAVAPEPAPSDADMSAAQGGGAADEASAVAGERSVIQTGEVSIQVDNPEKSSAAVATLADELGGYVQSETIGDAAGGYIDGSGTEPGRASSAYLQLRIPTERLDEAFRRFAEIGDITSQSRSADDVTAEHVDLQARVKALETSVARLTKLMAGATSTKDLLEAETALSQRQQELDGLRAQLKSLEGQVSEASVGVSLFTASTPLPGGPANFWEGLVAGWNSLGTAGSGALILVGILLPWLVLAAILTVAILLLVRSRRRAKRRHASLVGNENGSVPVQALATEVGAGSGPQAPHEHEDEAQRD